MASFCVIFTHWVLDVVMVLRDLFVDSLVDASKPMWFWHAMRPLRSDQNDVAVISLPPLRIRLVPLSMFQVGSSIRCRLTRHEL